MPLDLVMGVIDGEAREERSVDEFVQQIQTRADECYEVAREHLKASAERRKKTYDIRVKEAAFQVNEWVWYWYPRRYQKKSPKWQRSYVGPYLIVRAIPPVNFVIQKSARAKPVVVHADKLKKCHGQTPESWLTTAELPNCEDSIAVVTPSGNQVGVSDRVEVPPKQRRRVRFLLDQPEESRLPTIDEAPEGDVIEYVSTRPKRDNRKVPQRFKDYACTHVSLDGEGDDNVHEVTAVVSVEDIGSLQRQIEASGVVRWPPGQL
jgi:hypothetical protein